MLKLGTLLLVITLTLHFQASASTCPDLASGETTLDCPWAEIAREATAAGAQAPNVISKRAPEILAQLNKDRKESSLKVLWGKSINYDELVKGLIVDKAILESLSKLYGSPLEDRVAHAGLEHTYGYLFSILKTPFGFKRARWVGGVIEEGLGIEKGLLGPTPSQGTLLSNATQLLGRIAFSDRPKELAALKKSKILVPAQIATFTTQGKEVRTLHELVAEKNIILRTDLVRFAKVPAGQANSHLLVYSVRYLDQDRAELITAFPVESSFVSRVLDPARLGSDQEIVTRYNAQVADVTGHRWKGSRSEIAR